MGNFVKRRDRSPLCRLTVESLEIRRLLAVDHVVHISVDGLASRWLEPLVRNEQISPTGDYATFVRLQTEGSSTFNARTDYTHTVTLPNHTSMLTGRPVLAPSGLPATVAHEWTSNTDPPPGVTLHSHHSSSAYVSSVFDVVHDQGRSTALFATKSKFSLYDASYDSSTGAIDSDPAGGDNGRDKIDTYVSLDDSQVVVDQFVLALSREEFDYSFLHLAAPDLSGHRFGWGSKEWNDAVKEVDRLLNQLLNVITTDPGLQGSTAVIVTSDHGGLGNGHQNVAEVSNYRIPFYVWGAGVSAGADLYSVYATTTADPGEGRPDYLAAQQPIRNGDSGNLSLDLLGMQPVPGSIIRSLHRCQTDRDCATLPPATDLLDYGDAPAPFPSMRVAAGASHTIEPGFFLGDGVDAETDGQPDNQALGDDLAGDDEDGVIFSSQLLVGRSAEIVVFASQTGILQAWFDWNGDGDWNDSQEHVFADQRLSAGSNRLTIQVPGNLQPTTTYARFRFARQSGLSPIGPAGVGEVEDYVIQITSAPVTGRVVARDDSFRLKTGSGQFTLTVLENDVGTGELTVASVTQPARGSTQIATEGSAIWYTPANGFTGRDTFTYQVRDAQGATGQAQVTIDIEPRATVQSSRVALRLETTDDNGNLVSNVAEGDRFWLSLFVQDVRSGGGGVAAAYVDVAFDGNLSAAGPIQNGPFYASAPSGAVINGQINEVGGRSSVAGGTGERLLFTAPLIGSTAGTVQFSVDSADFAGHDIRLEGEVNPIPQSRWIVAPLEIEIIPIEQQVAEPLDVDRDGFVTPLDALLIINDLNAFGARQLAGSPFQPSHDVDVDDDGTVAAIDALLVINRLNSESFLASRTDAAIAAAIEGRSAAMIGNADPKRRAAAMITILADDNDSGSASDNRGFAWRPSVSQPAAN